MLIKQETSWINSPRYRSYSDVEYRTPPANKISDQLWSKLIYVGAGCLNFKNGRVQKGANSKVHYLCINTKLLWKASSKRAAEH